MTLKIYLADLTHDGGGVATEGMPLNIGLMASYARKLFGRDIDITLFKYTRELIGAIKTRPPDVLGCSNYVWNSSLSTYVSGMVKAIDPNIVTIWGGTNYPFETAQQEKFLRDHPLVDVHVYYEGEDAFANFLRRRLSVESGAALFREPIDGCQFLDRDSRTIVAGNRLARIRDLDKIPSPYASGVMDQFFDGVLTPLVETARGCPFHCNYCNAGSTYFDKVNKFSAEYVEEELTYIARKAAAAGIGHVTFTDNNFGMIPRDSATAELLARLKQDYGWPLTMTAFTGKNSKQRVIEVTKQLGGSLSISMAVQSMSPAVLKNIQRDNISIDDMMAISQEISAQGRPRYTEVIMPLPGETYQSHIEGIKKLLDCNITRLFSHTLQVLYGTPYKDDQAYAKRYGYQTRFRLVPLDFSRIGDDYVMDVEEVGVATKDLSFDDYVRSRVFMFSVDILHNTGIFQALEKYLRAISTPNSAFVANLYPHMFALPAPVDEVVKSFIDQTKSELWDSRDELIAHYSDPVIYQGLINGDYGGNVLFKHRIWMLSKHADQFVDWVFDMTNAGLTGVAGHDQRQYQAIHRFVTGLVHDCYSIEGIDLEHGDTIDYDILAWLERTDDAPLAQFRRSPGLRYRFYFDEHEKKIRRDGLRRYGATINGLIKLIQRLSAMPNRKAMIVGADTDAATDAGSGARAGAGMNQTGPSMVVVVA